MTTITSNQHQRTISASAHGASVSHRSVTVESPPVAIRFGEGGLSCSKRFGMIFASKAGRYAWSPWMIRSNETAEISGASGRMGAPGAVSHGAAVHRKICRRPAMMVSRPVTRMVLAIMPLVAMLVFGPPARAGNEEVSARRSSERTLFTNDEIVDGFFKIAFGAELRLDGGVDRIRKFDGPVRVYVDNRTKTDRRDVIAAAVADIREHVDNLDLALTDDRRAANLVVTIVRNRDLKRTIRSFYGPERAKQIDQRLTPECLSGFSEDPQHRIRRSEVILTVDGGDFRFADCAYEELLQALGPINDDRSVPWTMFNDDVQMGFFDIYDQYLLNILYDSRVRPGMTRAEVKAVLPDVMPDVRQRVSRTNPGLRAQIEMAPN
jgi:hypothetical protein